jgi:hypothetical protein
MIKINEMKYLKIQILILFIALAGVMICSCDRDELFEREQYKNVFALLSDDGFNVFYEEHDLALSESSGFVSAVCGGALPTEKDINITIVEDEDLLLQYNRSNFDVDESKYARWLPRDRYDINNYNITIPAGERTGLMPITIRLEGLSPDSTYYIPLRVDRFSSYELNQEKGTVLYCVLMKNDYALQRITSQGSVPQGTDYNYRGIRNGANIMSNRQIFPVSGNSVRIVAMGLEFEQKVSSINGRSILLTVDENNKVRITAWKDLEITQVDDDPDYPNTFSIEDDGYNRYQTFLLRYDYVYDGTTYSVKEEVRREFKEENKY